MGTQSEYEEILEFFIAWLRKNPPPEFADWVWDSRRALAIKGEDEDFRRGMVACLQADDRMHADNGIQVIMFTHQSGSIWADMANIVWASGLHVTAAWYVVTETDSALREGSYVKGTVLLVLRKRSGFRKTTRDDLAWEIQEEVEEQVAGAHRPQPEREGPLPRRECLRGRRHPDGRLRRRPARPHPLRDHRRARHDRRGHSPTRKGETTFVDGLIAFAVDTANQCLVPQGIPDGALGQAQRRGALLPEDARHGGQGAKTLDNYQNFAKAFKVRDFKALLASHKANEARLKSAVEFGRAEMGEGSELYESVLRAVLYCRDGTQQRTWTATRRFAHLTLNVPDYYGDMTSANWLHELGDYLAKRLDGLRPEEASNARVLYELVKNQRLG